MTTYHLDREPSRPLPRKRTLLLVSALVVAAWLVVTAATGGRGSAGDSQVGPTVDVAPRDLTTTLDAYGSLQRSGEQVVAHAGPLPAGGPGGPSEADPGADGDTPAADPVAYVTPGDDTPTTSPSSTTSPTSSSTSTTSTTEPCPATSSTTSSTTSTSSTSTPCPPTSTSTTTPGTTPTTAPPTPTTGPPPGGEPPAKDGGPGEDGGALPGRGPGQDGGPAGDGDRGGPGGRPGGRPDGQGDDPVDVPASTLTSALDVGATADRGTVLYTADGQPVVSLIGDLPAWRALELGIDDGVDVQQLEENLTALGYGTGLVVDQSFTAETAAAVAAWETDLGRADPDGSVAVGDVVFLTTPGDVLGHDATVGDTLRPGRAGPAATIRLVDAERQAVIAVPVAAVVDGDGSPAVRVVHADDVDRLVPIETGLVADGWVEVVAGLEGTEKVRLPG